MTLLFTAACVLLFFGGALFGWSGAVAAMVIVGVLVWTLGG